MHSEEIQKAMFQFLYWHEGLPILTDMTSLEYSYERNHITETEFKDGVSKNEAQIELVKSEFLKYQVYFDIDQPFYLTFLDNLKKFGDSIDEKKEYSNLSNPGFTKALISDVLKAISDPKSREEQKIWIFLRIADFLKSFPELSPTRGT